MPRARGRPWLATPRRLLVLFAPECALVRTGALRAGVLGRRSLPGRSDQATSAGPAPGSGARDRRLEVLAGVPGRAHLGSGRQPAATAHLVDLGARLQVLCTEGGLDSLEEALEPSQQLSLGEPDLGFARGVLERQGQRLELVLQLLRHAFLERGERPLVDLAEPLAPGLIGLGLAHVLKQLADHRRDADQLGRLLDDGALRVAGEDHRQGLLLFRGRIVLALDRHGSNPTTPPKRPPDPDPAGGPRASHAPIGAQARTLPDSDGRAERDIRGRQAGRLGREITMTRWLVIVGLVLGACATIGVDHAAASMASIVTVAPVVEDEGQAGVEAAAASALRRAVRGAQAMGLDEVMLKSIRLVPGTGVVVEIIASESNEPGDDRDTDGDIERSKLQIAPGTRL